MILSVPWCARISRCLFRRGGLLRMLVLSSLVVAGCASSPVGGSEATIAPDLRFAVPTPRELGCSIAAEQLVTARYRDEVVVFQAHLTVSPQRLSLIGFDSFGRRAFTITSADGSASFEAEPGLPQGLRLANILADLAIVYWPADAVERGLPRSVEVREEGNERSIFAGGHEVIRVDYDAPPGCGWPELAHYRNEAFGYALDLHSRRISR